MALPRGWGRLQGLLEVKRACGLLPREEEQLEWGSRGAGLHPAGLCGRPARTRQEPAHQSEVLTVRLSSCHWWYSERRERT